METGTMGYSVRKGKLVKQERALRAPVIAKLI
jgi:hypothetical protein